MQHLEACNVDRIYRCHSEYVSTLQLKHKTNMKHKTQNK